MKAIKQTRKRYVNKILFYSLSKAKDSLATKITRNQSCQIRVISQLFDTKKNASLDIDSSVASRQPVNSTQKHYKQKEKTSSIVTLKKMRSFNQKNDCSEPLIVPDEKVAITKTCKCTKKRDLRTSMEEPCGLYCKYLNPNEQKDIVFKRTLGICANTNFEKYNFVLPADWWRIWCDFVNIEYKSLQDHIKDSRAQASDSSKCANKAPMSTLQITEESDVDFDLRTFMNEESKARHKRESSILNLLQKD